MYKCLKMRRCLLPLWEFQSPHTFQKLFCRWLTLNWRRLGANFSPGRPHNSLCFLTSPRPCKIYEKCPGAHEMLPHLILCDRITTVSVQLQELIQDRVHWSFRGKGNGEKRGGRVKARQVEGCWQREREGEREVERGGERWRADEDFFAFRTQTRAARLIEVSGND